MRKLMILCTACLMALCAMAQTIDAIKVTQGETTDWYPFGESSRIDVAITNGNPMFPNKTYDLAQGDVTTTFGIAPEDTWYTVRTDGVAGNWNTICLEKNITAIDGATFWTISGQDANSFVLDEITAPEAGRGYIIRFTKDKLKVQYGNETAAEPVVATAGNPMQGTYKQIDAAAENELNGNYVVYNNQLCPVVSWVGLYAHRAYVVASFIPNEVPAPAPGRQRAFMPKPKETPTNLEANIESQQPKDGKYIINGQFVIVKDNKMYNAQGIEL